MPADASTSAPTLLLAGGGTGGHIFPALAIAEQAQMQRPGARCRVLCSTRPLDSAILSRERLGGAPVSFTPIAAQPFGLRPRAMLRFVGSWGGAVRAGRQVIREARTAGPVVVAALGGFVAAPIVQAARVERCPVLLVNLDAVPGKANRWIARHARRVLTAAKPAPGHGGPAWELIPPIVRAGAASNAPPAECRRGLGLAPDMPTLLVTGGSQGAGSINALLARLAADGALAGWQVIHQTGAEGVDEARVAYASAGVAARVERFFSPIAPCWGAADLAVSRAGAGSVAEAWCNRVPAVFLPYPYHADQHQKHNAAVLVEAGGAMVVTDRIDAAQNAAEAGAAIAALLRDGPARASMRAALASLGPADGATRAATALLALAAQSPETSHAVQA